MWIHILFLHCALFYACIFFVTSLQCSEFASWITLSKNDIKPYLNLNLNLNRSELHVLAAFQLSGAPFTIALNKIEGNHDVLLFTVESHAINYNRDRNLGEYIYYRTQVHKICLKTAEYGKLLESGLKIRTYQAKYVFFSSIQLEYLRYFII